MHLANTRTRTEWGPRWRRINTARLSFNATLPRRGRLMVQARRGLIAHGGLLRQQSLAAMHRLRPAIHPAPRQGLTLAHVMRQPKAPPAARVMAANALLDRGWGKAAQLVAVDGEVRELVEVKLNVVQASHALPKTELIDAQPNDINDLGADTICVCTARRATTSLSNSNHG